MQDQVQSAAPLRKFARRSLRPFAVLAAFAIVTGGLGACATPAEPEEASLSIRIDQLPAWDAFDLLTFPAGNPSAQAQYEPLLRLDQEGQPEPWLAESYELSDDGLTMTLSLRQDVDFTDGTHLNAATVKKFLDAYYSVTGLFAAYSLEIEELGEYALEFTTTRPMRGRFFTDFSWVLIASPAGFDDAATQTTMPAGSGPYLIEDVVPDVSISFVRNPDYWAPDAYPYDTVEMTVFDDDIAAVNALSSGQLDAAYIVDLSVAAGAAESVDLELNLGVGLSPSLFFIDREGSTFAPIADVRVRQAINMAFDRDAINDSLNFGLGQVSSQPFLPFEPSYVEGGDDRYPYDVDGAKDLLAEAGYPDGFELTVASVPGFTDHYEPALQQSLAEIGITLNLETVLIEDAISLFVDKWPNGVYPVASYPMAVGSTRYEWIDQYLGGFKDPVAQGLYDKFLYGDNDEAAEAIGDLGEYILEQAWFAPFSAPPAVVLSRPGYVVDIGAATSDGNSQFTPFWLYRLAD